MSKYVKSFDGFKNIFKAKPFEITVDNVLAKLHYKVTTCILFLCSILVTSQELIGEHIRCLSDKQGVPEHVLNTFCFFTTTFTIVDGQNATDLHRFGLYPGVGPVTHKTQEEKHHAYYQWVPFVLFLQALMFYAPHRLWKSWEGGELKNIMSELQFAHFSIDKDIKVAGRSIPCLSKKNEALKQLSRIIFKDRSVMNKSRCRKFLSCELLYLINLIFQAYITNKIFKGQFLTLGTRLYANDDISVLDSVFPKMTKCTFHKYGPSGLIQSHDALCVMALNILNEKIYTFLWFWFVFLFVVSTIGFIWRVISMCFYRSARFTRFVFSWYSPVRLDLLPIVTCNYPDWLYLLYLSKNMDQRLFQHFLVYLRKETCDYSRILTTTE